MTLLYKNYTMRNNSLKKVSVCAALLLACMSVMAQDVMTMADSGVYMFNPLPTKDLRVRVQGLSCGPLPGGLLVQQYVPQDTVTVYGVALTMRNNCRNGSFDSIIPVYRAVLMQRAAGTVDLPFPPRRTLSYVDSITLAPDNIKQCLFRYQFQSPSPYTSDMPCVEFYFNTPMQINRMSDTFYVGREYFSSSDSSFYPSEYSGWYDTPPALCHFWYVGYPDTTQFYDRQGYSTIDMDWGFSFPIIGFRCKPLDEETHTLSLTNLTGDGATVNWYSVEEGTTYNVRLYSTDGEVDTVAETTDSSYTFSGLPQDKCYRVQVRKQCHYATANYDTTVYSSWTVTPTSFILGDPSSIDTTGTGGDTTIVDTTHVDTVGIAVRLLERYVNLQPNPAADQVLVTSGFGLQEIEVFNAAGVKVDEQKAAGYAANFDISTLPAGPYLVRIATPRGTVTKKLVVQRR